MSLKPMPFLSGRVPSSSELHGRHDSPSDIVSVISLPKVQQALWLDYLVRPYACHYYLRLEVDLTSLSPTLERLLEGTFGLFAVGHHIAADGFSLSVLSKEILSILEPPTEQLATEELGLSYGEYVQK
ncbi:hypothetical protein A1F97_07603 [Pyrenophora tritici-repentis]|nr:Condensation domain containing protein [Pyrenophora tritici-repentis]KAI1687764.1 hypothetical protein KJE20_00941 [Pyrenophora tritici-repentis]PZD23465.1 hypothetical protein A1F96_10225 [Pyrenophora tritici-repentis]PZD37412.1 hypothetical protein A1F97_07603 [Pyrenophora tritici-repentis]